MLNIVTGKSCSGKDTFCKGLNKVIAYTTRPPRNNEVNHIDYHFTELTDFGLCYRRYVNNWTYWFSPSDVLAAIDSNEEYYLITDLAGCKELCNAFPEVKVIYLECSLLTRMKRYYQRDGIDYKEAMRRLIADEEENNLEDYIELGIYPLVINTDEE